MKKILLLLSILVLVLLVGCTTTECDNTQLQEEVAQLKTENIRLENFYSNYNNGGLQRLQGISERDNAETNYQLWSIYYEEGAYAESIEFCEGAREIYASSNIYHQTAIEYYKETKKVATDKYIELIDAYINFSSSSIDLNWAMYEACEYFEVASKNYAEGRIEKGTDELENGNEKIVKHDSLIKQHNMYVARIGILEDKI